MIKGLAGFRAVLSIDTRKASVARAAADAGATVLNDVSALTHDPASLDVAAKTRMSLVLMHAQGEPKTMQDNPAYADVVLEVFDYLEGRIEAAEAAGILRARIAADPGIGFGKTMAHTLALLANLSLFHGLGVPLLIGASRKRFIKGIAGGEAPAMREPGSQAAAIASAAQSAQMFRVHDVAGTAQALARQFRAPTVALAFPGVVAMIPGAYAFRAVFGALQIAEGATATVTETLSLSATVGLMVGAIAVGVAAPALLIPTPSSVR